MGGIKPNTITMNKGIKYSTQALLALLFISVVGLYGDYTRYDWRIVNGVGQWDATPIRSDIWTGDIYFSDGAMTANLLVRIEKELAKARAN